MTSQPVLRIVLLDSIPTWGGGEAWCVRTTAALERRGHRVVIACDRGSALEERARDQGLEVWAEHLTGPRALLAARRLARRMREDGTEILIANLNRDVRMGASACSRSGARLVQRRGIARRIKPTRRSRALYTGPVRHVIVNCQAILDEMTAGADWLDRSRFTVVPNGIEVGAEPTSAEREEARVRLEIASDRPCACIVARLAPMKGHAYLLAAWPTVLERLPGALLLVAGAGESAAELRASALRQDLGESVRFLGFLADPRPVLVASDLFVLASVRDEGCNNTLLEAMECGLPAVVTRCGGLVEQVLAGETGRIVPIGDGPALGSAIAELLGDPALRGRMARAARQRALSNYALPAVTERLEQLLLSIRAGP